MLIALITDEYPPARAGGGIGNYTKALAGLLVRSGEHEVHVFCQDDRLEKPSSGEHIHIVRSWNPSTRVGRWLYHHALGLIGPFAYRFAWGLAVAKTIRTVEARIGRRFDVLEIPEAGGYGAIIGFGGITNATVIRLHACTGLLRKYGALQHTRNERLCEMMERWSIARADVITSPSSALVRESEVPLRIGNRPCLIYPNVRASREAHALGDTVARRDLTVLVVGRLCHLKGTDLVIEAIGLLQKERYPRLQLILAGRSDWAPEHVSGLLSAHLAPGTYVTLGEAPRARVQMEMRTATMLVQASRFENYPTTILEAFEHLCPVVAAEVGGIPELVTNGVTGLLFPPGSTTALAQQIARVLDNPLESKCLSARAREWAEYVLSDVNLQSAIDEAYGIAIEAHSARTHSYAAQSLPACALGPRRSPGVPPVRNLPTDAGG